MAAVISKGMHWLDYSFCPQLMCVLTLLKSLEISLSNLIPINECPVQVLCEEELKIVRANDHQTLYNLRELKEKKREKWRGGNLGALLKKK